MNEREWQYLSPIERTWRDASGLPTSYLLKCLALKLRRRLWGKRADRNARFVWTPFAVAEAEEPQLVARTFREHTVIRAMLQELPPLHRICEVGCGYGRMLWVLQEFAPVVVGFEREPHLVAYAEGEFTSAVRVERVSELRDVPLTQPYDLAMTFTVLQHLTDVDSRAVCARLRALAPTGYVLLVEKTDSSQATLEYDDGRRFLNRQRSVATYEEYLDPFRLVATRPRPPEPPRLEPDGTCMLFRAP